ncbi:MAG: hypothetical protein QOD03_1620, partial [Verrucomicrobiota bacterium]
IAPASHPHSEIPEVTVYWSNGELDRYTLLQAILSKLDRAGWGYKTDSGWTRNDLEIPTDIWSRIRLTTVSEELEQGKKNFRCRIQGFWSLPAKVICGTAIALMLFVIPAFAEKIPWLWMSLVLLPLIWWFFEDERIEYERALAALIDEAATDQKLVKLKLGERK